MSEAAPPAADGFSDRAAKALTVSMTVLDDQTFSEHRLRVAFARGERPIPWWAILSAIDEDLGQHLSSDPRIATAGGRTEVLDAR